MIASNSVLLRLTLVVVAISSSVFAIPRNTSPAPYAQLDLSKIEGRTWFEVASSKIVQVSEELELIELLGGRRVVMDLFMSPSQVVFESPSSPLLPSFPSFSLEFFGLHLLLLQAFIRG